MPQPPVLDELVMRSVYLPASADGKLRELAHNLTNATGRNVTKSDLIRAAILEKLADWAKQHNKPEQILQELDLGQRGR